MTTISLWERPSPSPVRLVPPAWKRAKSRSHGFLPRSWYFDLSTAGRVRFPRPHLERLRALQMQCSSALSSNVTSPSVWLLAWACHRRHELLMCEANVSDGVQLHWQATTHAEALTQEGVCDGSVSPGMEPSPRQPTTLKGGLCRSFLKSMSSSF